LGLIGVSDNIQLNMEQKKLAVVTGGAGFIGSHLCERLVTEGYQVISLDNYFTGTTENHVSDVEYRKGCTKNIAEHISEKPDIIFHLGEYARVEQSFDDIEKVFAYNTTGTQAVLEFVRKTNAKLIYAGSSTKYADGGIGRDQSPYAWTKASNTNLVQRYGDWFDINYAITYFYNVYGPRERCDMQTGTLISIFADRRANDLPLLVREPGTQRRNFTHVFDIVDGLFKVGEAGSGDEYGIGHPDSYSVLEVAKMFDCEIELTQGRAGNRMTSVVDSKRTELELDWKPTYNLPDYINGMS
jgi:UDP-glucose 4-epimerase